jgi:hypothetical protein
VNGFQGMSSLLMVHWCPCTCVINPAVGKADPRMEIVDATHRIRDPLNYKFIGCLIK